MKTTRQASLDKQPEEPIIKKAAFESEPESEKEPPKLSEKIVIREKAPAPSATAPSSPDLRTRILNATKAIKDLGGKIDDTDLSDLTDEELQLELAELTNQYKRLKNSKAGK